ncbi:VWA domain-containing protein [Halovenus rubra]|uniref:VWA domain-containing protein n=2 Tax=Halovenus rubra TaxID=869890 RepID=A0ACC7E3Q8_9EURY|nr:VWA domain-containing protein [Halovenus rubra]
MRTVLLIVLVAVLVLTAGCLGSPLGGDDGIDKQAGTDGSDGSDAGGDGTDGAASGNDGQLGYSVGGASDINNFRDNVEEGYLPLAADVTAEGAFKEYYFDTGATERCEELFCPSYSQAVSADPLSGEAEQYLTVGLNSGIEKSEFERDDLNLVVVVDTSGSMGDPFNSYYYDDDGERVETEERQKMGAAVNAVKTLVGQLDGPDRVGVVSFNDGARAVAPMQRVDERDMSELHENVESMSAYGGTNLDAGMQEAEEMVSEYADDSERETRVIYVTDAMPNQGGTSSEHLGDQLSDHAEDDIHSTFVGVGVDFNADLVDTITDTRGANYYSVQSAAQFQERMDEGFDYMVNPLVFNLSLSVETEGYKVEQVYGTASDGALDGNIMHVKTLFPSRTEGNRTKGGVVLLKLNDSGTGDAVELQTSYETGAGEDHTTTETVEFADREPEYFQNNGIRKAVALSRYVELSQNWIAYERGNIEGESPDAPEGGIESKENPYLGQWERQSEDLQVSPAYADRFATLVEYFESEIAAVGDESLQQELDILDLLIEAGSVEEQEDSNSVAVTVP